MRIAIDARYVRERPSGIGAYVRALIERVPKFSPEHRFLLWRDPRAPQRLSSRPNVAQCTVSTPANSIGTLAWPTRLADMRDVDVFHAPFNLLGRGIQCGTVTTIHDLMWLTAPHLCETPSPLTPVFRRFYGAGIRRALKHSSRIIAISKATADAIRLVAPEASPRVRVIHHGIDARFTPGKADAAAVTGREGDYFLVVGQNSPSKSHADILEAFAAADLPKTTSLVLLQRLYQKGRFGLSKRSALAPLAERLGIADRVVWLSGIDNEAVVTLLRGAQALVQFSRYEGFGMPLLEAAACGTPVIASDIAPLVEVSGGAALHVPLLTAELARAMGRVGQSTAFRQELSERGLQRARDFSWDKCAESHLECYREAG
ncbi:MAG: glycosyltransferase involved in cell wall biosynthesis [Myxococcota bacterium]|jgi:glycosyltransferase involved in cell wall biosynthesis